MPIVHHPHLLQVCQSLLRQEALELNQIPRVAPEQRVRDVAQQGHEPQDAVQADVEEHLGRRGFVQPGLATCVVDGQAQQEVGEIAHDGQQADEGRDAVLGVQDGEGHHVVETVGAAADLEQDGDVGGGEAGGHVRVGAFDFDGLAAFAFGGQGGEVGVLFGGQALLGFLFEELFRDEVDGCGSHGGVGVLLCV